MATVTLEHFKRAAADIALNGDNDMLPFDVDTRFIAENQEELSKMAFEFFAELDKQGGTKAASEISQLTIFNERLLAPTGAAGFRVATKIHPFWNLYFNGLGVAVAEAHEPIRSNRAHAYRMAKDGDRLFDRAFSWRAFREVTLAECKARGDECVIVQTDVSSFYEHLYHHRIENYVRDLFPADATVADQIDRLLNQFSSFRSFGLPVGSQCSRVIAEVVMSAVDRRMADLGIVAHRYVDDFVLVTTDHKEAYTALAELSHALANYGLTLNRTKTTLLTGKHYADYVTSQLGGNGDQADVLRAIDLHYDPYSDRSEADYEELKETVENLEIRTLLDVELRKAQPDNFLVTQIGRTLKLHNPDVALQLCNTLLAPTNLHAFRASWSTIMRGIASVRSDEKFAEIFEKLDLLLDGVPRYSEHLLVSEASFLHYLRTVRFGRTDARAAYVLSRYQRTTSQTIRRSCIDCWRQWKDRDSFISVLNRWPELKAEEGRMLWVAAGDFGDDGKKFQNQRRGSLEKAWALGIERQNKPAFYSLFSKWSEKRG